MYATPVASATFEHPTDQASYRVIISGELLADGSSETRALAVRYFMTALEAGGLDAFALPVAVAYRSLDGQLLGTSEFSVLAIRTPVPLSTSRASGTQHGPIIAALNP